MARLQNGSTTRMYGIRPLALLALFAAKLAWADSSDAVNAVQPDALPAEEGALPPLPRQMWLRGGVLFDRPEADWPNGTGMQIRSPICNGAVGRLVPDPVLVDILVGGKLRAHLDDGRTVEGWQPSRNYGLILKVSELGLFAQEDVPLIYGDEHDSRPVGKVLRGAFVPVKRIEKDQAVVASGSVWAEMRHCRVRLSALGLTRTDPPQRPASDAWLYAWGHELTFSPEPSAFRTVYVICAPARKLEDRLVDGELTHRLAVYADGIEIEGWASEKRQGHWTACNRTMLEIPPCYPRILNDNGDEVIPPMGQGYVTLPKMDRARLHSIRKWFRKTRFLYIPHAGGRDPEGSWRISCFGFKVKHGMLEYLDPAPLVYDAVYYAVGWGGIELGGLLEFQSPDGRRQILESDGKDYNVVAFRRDWIEVVLGDHLRGYHPDDTEIWYRTLEGCKQNATLGHVSTMF